MSRQLDAFAGALRLQLRLLPRELNYLLPLVVAPLLTAVFLTIVGNAGRTDLVAYALFAPALMSLWTLALFVSGGIVDDDRALGTIELLLASPAAFAAVVVGRVLAVTCASLFAFVEVWLVARLGFGAAIHVHHPVVLLAGLAVTVFAMSGTAVSMAALFVHSRNARIFQNSLSYPFYVLGGVMAPVALLPGWIRWASGGVFLSWSADLLRATLWSPPPRAVALHLAVIASLGLAGLVVGHWALQRLVERARRDGTLALW